MALRLGGSGQLDRAEVELSESPAAPANDTNTHSGGTAGSDSLPQRRGRSMNAR